MARDKEEPVRGDVGLRVDEVPDRASRMIEPRPSANATLR